MKGEPERPRERERFSAPPFHLIPAAAWSHGKVSRRLDKIVVRAVGVCLRCAMIFVATFKPHPMDDAAPLIFPGLPGGAN
jgi:hypothetical protein